MKRTLALILTVLMVLTLIPASLLNVLARGPGVAANKTPNQTIPNAEGQFIPETVLVDGIINDTAWPEEDWNDVTSETGTWDVQYPDDANLSKNFKYQLKVDSYYLYGAVVMNSAPTGDVTLWINDGSLSGTYTDKFVIDFSAGTVKRFDRDGNEINSYLAQYGVEYAYETFEYKFDDEKTLVEFRSHRADFSTAKEATFSYFISAEFEEGESLYHPAIAVNGLTGDARDQLFPSLNYWPAGAQQVTSADVNGYGALSLAENTYIDIDGRLDEAIWAAQTEFYLKWYDRLALPSWTDNLQGGAAGGNSDASGNYKDFADVSANVLPYNDNAAAKFDLYVTNGYIYGAALVHDDSHQGLSSTSSTENTGVRFYMTQAVDGGTKVVQVDLRYAATSTVNDYGRFTINGVAQNPDTLGISDGYVSDGYFDIGYLGNYEYDDSYGRYYPVGTTHSATTGYPTLGFTYSHRPAGPNLYVFEFMIDRNAWGDDFASFIPEKYNFAAFSELSDTFDEVTGTSGETYKNATSEYPELAGGILPRYFKNPNGEFYEPYTKFTPDATLGERFWPGMVSSADVAVNSNYYGSSNRVNDKEGNISYYPLIRGDLNYLYGSVVIETSDLFGEWKAGSANGPDGGDVFELWLAENSAYSNGVYDGTTHRYGVWMDENGNAHAGYYSGGAYHDGGDAWKAVIKKYEDSVIKKPVYENFGYGEETGGYDEAYIEEVNDYYVIEFRIPLDAIGDGITLDINDGHFNNENVLSDSDYPIAYYYTSLHVAPADDETENTEGFTMFYPRSANTVSSHTIDTITSEAINYNFPQIFNEHDVFFAITVDGKIIEEQRVPLESSKIDFSNSEYRVPSQNGNILGYNAMLLTGSEYTLFGATIDGVLKRGAYSDSNKTMVTLWIRDNDANQTIYKYDFFNDGEYNYLYVNGTQYAGLGAWSFSSANNETYFEAGILTENFDAAKDGFEYFIEVTQVIGDEELSRVTPKIKLPVIENYAEYFVPQGLIWTKNAGSIKKIEHFAPDAIYVDGNFNDTGWKPEWTFVSREINACGQETSDNAPDLAKTDFYYQLRMDDEYLYVAAVIEYYDGDGNKVDASTVSANQNPGFRLWIKSGEFGDNVAAGNSKTYTNYYDVKLGELQSQENTFPTFANNTRPFYNKYYQYVNPDANRDGYFTSADYATGNSTINTVVDANNKFSTFMPWGYGDSTLWGETKVTHGDAEGVVVNSKTGETRGEMVDTGAIIKKIEELKKTGGDAAVDAYIAELATKDENPSSIEVSTGVEAAVMETGAGKRPNGFSAPLENNTMVVEFKVELDEFGGRDVFEYYVSSATHNSWTSKTTMYPAIVSDPGSGSNYYHVNYPYWKWTDEHSVVVDEEVRAELMMRTYKKPVITLGAKVSQTYSYYDKNTDTLHENVDAIRFGGLWTEEYIRKVNGLLESDGYTLTGKDDNKAYEGDNSVGNYTDYWDVEAMGMVILPTHLVGYNDKNDAAHPGKYDLFIDNPKAAWMDADGIVNWVGNTDEYPDDKVNFADYENFAFYVTVVNAPTNMNFCFRGFVTYYDEVSGATPYYDAILERSIDTVVAAASNSTDGDQTFEDEALAGGAFTDDYYKPGTGTDGIDKENGGQGGETPEPEKIVIDSIELVTDGSIKAGNALLKPTVYSINGDTSLAEKAIEALSVQWYTQTALCPDDGVFEAGTVYDLLATLDCTGDYVFGDNCKITLQTADEKLNGSHYELASTETEYVGRFTVAVEAEKLIINSIELVTDGSTAPGSAMFVPTVKSINGDASLVESVQDSLVVQWWNEDASVKYDHYSATLVPGLTYDLYIKFNINSGYEFSDTCEMTLETADGTLIGEYFPDLSTETGRSYDFWITPEGEVDPDSSINFTTINSSTYAADTTILLASNTYASINSQMIWWNKVLLEYDDNAGNYKVIATAGSGSSDHFNWDYGIDRIIVAAHNDDVNTNANLADFNFLGSLAVGQRVIIVGATHEELKNASANTDGTAISMQLITVSSVETPIPEIVTPDNIGALVPNYSNGEKVAYVPLDDRPVHTDRVQYLAQASGMDLVMPSASDYSTVLGTNGHGGNPANILAWLIQQENSGVDYYVIALDQVFSGGLVNSRYSDSSFSDGGLTAHDLEAVEFLTDLAKNNYVVYTDTVMRLASTSGYRDHNATTYDALRAYGAQVRQELPDSKLTIDNVISSYRYGTDGVSAIPYTNTIENISATATEAQIDGYLAARERKLRIIDYLIKNAGGNIDRLMIGVDDSSAEYNLQANEIKYIKSLINNPEYNLNATVFAGADEMGVMGIAATANDNFLASPLKIQFKVYGPAAGAQADKYDNGTLSESLKAHLAAVGGVQTTDSNEADIQVLVLTRAQESVDYTGDASYNASLLAADLIANLNNNVPTIIIDASNHYGGHANYAINAMINAGVFNRNDATEILGYSQWNTVGNAVGIAMANGIARYAYLMGADEVTATSNEGFMKSYMFSMIKDNCYKPYSSTSWTPQTGDLYAWKLMPMIDNSNLILGKDGAVVSTGYTSSWIANITWPWGRDFEVRFDIGFN